MPEFEVKRLIIIININIVKFTLELAIFKKIFEIVYFIDQKSISRYDTKVAKELTKNGIRVTILY